MFSKTLNYLFIIGYNNIQQEPVPFYFYINLVEPEPAFFKISGAGAVPIWMAPKPWGRLRKEPVSHLLLLEGGGALFTVIAFIKTLSKDGLAMLHLVA